MVRLAASLSLLLIASHAASCGRAAEFGEPSSEESAANEREGACPARRRAPAELPNTKPEHEQLAYWLGVYPERELDQVLLAPGELAVHNEALRNAPDGTPRVVDLQRALGAEELSRALGERLEVYRSSFASGQYLSERESAQRELAAGPEALAERRELRVALAPIDLRCAPFPEPVRSKQGRQDFDRNRCSQARAQEPIELLGSFGPMRLARTRYAFGFIDPAAPLSPPVPNELAARYRGPPALELAAPLELAGQKLPAGSLLYGADGGAVWLATQDGFVRSRPLAAREAQNTERPLSWRAFLSEAFRYLRAPYGWGDEGGGRDCSRFVLDVLASFGLTLPRTSLDQSRSGRYVVEVPAETSETERLALLDATHARGVVLIHFPGHIMFYLGRDREGVPRVLHSFAEYLAPCAGGGETLFEVGRVSVTDLSLGKGTSRRSFLERMTQLTVFGKAPGHELLALSRFRAPVPPRELAPASCRDSTEIALFRSPREPDESRPLRVIAVSAEDLRPASLWLVAPDGALVAPPIQELGVGPYARWLEVAAPAPGKWRALLADGAQTLACEEFRVAPRTKLKGEAARAGEGPAWQASLRWERDTEALYAAFVEQLFSHPVEDLKSWSSLSELLQKPERNLLYDHRGLDEDARLTLAPDCADLPYLLRAYFAWKLGLPFAFRQCSRGRAGVAPRCDEPISNEVPVEAANERAAFEAFWHKLRAGVHSASGRTLPDDPATDLYPVALERAALPPGTVFADPYGHMIVVAKWLPQGLAGKGMLLGADAQPDATVGRRRFWRGNFLFTPDTRDVGAGFKAFRPILAARDPRAASSARGAQTAAEGAREGRSWLVLDDKAIAQNRDFAPPSRQQYQGGADDFYARMDQLIYPRPVAMLDRMRSVVDALAEQVERRVEAIDVGEAGLRGRSDPINMPDGYAIFETSGAWEDFATPSRDMRLLIAIDAVRGFPGQVRAEPERFGVQAGERALGELEARLEELLKSRRFRYTRSDGSGFELSLADVVARGERLEAAYNPNDCVEARWGAPEDGPEYASCKRRAPPPQRAQMERYRSWFHERRRPARP